MSCGHGALPSRAPRPAAVAEAERCLLRGGGAVLLRLEPDDELTVIDLEGRQRCELAVFA
ncbi:MAG: hypothetical protein IRY94_18685, partial [Rhodospirillaceae bacterium]|nr:hypothetical protein [Rhodospirillaceae bacterium]